MTLVEAANNFRAQACACGNYDEMSKSEIINGYCDAIDLGDTALANGYYAAIMLRYWYKLYEWRDNSASLHLEDQDFIAWLHDAIWYAVTHKAWRDPSKSIYQDPDGPDKAIQACCGSMRGMAYQYYNKDKRKSNVQVYSIDASQDENGDSALAFTGAVSEDPSEGEGARSLIERFFTSGKYIEALLLDGVINFDAYKEVSEEVEYDSYNEETGEVERVTIKRKNDRFDERKLIKHISTINQSFMVPHLVASYGLTEDKAMSIVDMVKSVNNTKLYKMWEKTKIEIASNPDLLALLYSH